MMRNYLLMLLVLAIMLASGSAALAENGNEEDERRELTLEESMEKAISHSFQIRKSYSGAERAYFVRQRAAEDRDDQDPLIPTLDYAMALNVAQMDIQWRLSRREIDLLKERLEYDTARLYYDVLGKEAAVEYAESELQYREKEAKRALAMYNAGAISRLELDRAERSLDNAEAELRTKRQEKDNAYEQLNRMIGLPSQERPFLVDVPEWDTLRDIGVNTYVARAMDRNTALWLAEQQIELAKYDKKQHQHFDIDDVTGDPGAPAVPTEAKDKEIQMARYDYQDTKRQIEQLTRNIYHKVRMLEEENEKLANSLDELHSELAAMQTRYEAGVVTQYDFLEMQANLDQLKLQEKSLLLEHELAKFEIRRPWVLDGGAR